MKSQINCKVRAPHKCPQVKQVGERAMRNLGIGSLNSRGDVLADCLLSEKARIGNGEEKPQWGIK